MQGRAASNSASTVLRILPVFAAPTLAAIHAAAPDIHIQLPPSPFLALATIACASCSAASSRWMPSCPADTSMAPARRSCPYCSGCWCWRVPTGASIALVRALVSATRDRGLGVARSQEVEVGRTASGTPSGGWQGFWATTRASTGALRTACWTRLPGGAGLHNAGVARGAWEAPARVLHGWDAAHSRLHGRSRCCLRPPLSFSTARWSPSCGLQAR